MWAARDGFRIHSQQQQRGVVFRTAFAMLPTFIPDPAHHTVDRFAGITDLQCLNHPSRTEQFLFAVHGLQDAIGEQRKHIVATNRKLARRIGCVRGNSHRHPVCLQFLTLPLSKNDRQRVSGIAVLETHLRGINHAHQARHELMSGSDPAKSTVDPRDHSGR